jgi:serine/threonine protein kinase
MLYVRPLGERMIGETLGSYRVTALIGQGGMGTVYAGEHPLMGRKVAVKVLRPELCGSHDDVERFFNEARATARLRHPAFVDVLDCGLHAATGSAFIIMELLEGETLAERLARRGRLPAPEAAWLAHEIAGAVGVAHAAGIIHRDLKPDNVFLATSTRDGRGMDQVKVLDFGIAKLLGGTGGNVRATRTGVVLGTPIFMSPEQCRGKGTVDQRADVYAMGGILFAMLCGRPPFDSDSVGELIGLHQHAPPPVPRSLEPSVPPALEALILRALAKSPGDRPGTMSQVAEALAPFAAEYGPASDGRGPRRLPGTMRLPPRDERLITLDAPPGSQTTFSTAAAESQVKLSGRDRPPVRIGRAAIAGGVGAALTGLVAFLIMDQRPTIPAAAPETEPQHRPATPLPVRAVAPAPPEEQLPPPPPAPAPAPAPAVAAPAAPKEEIAEQVTIRLGNRRPGLKLSVTVDGERAALPLRLPRDGKRRVVKVEIPNFKPEEFPVTANRDHTLKLRYAPAPLTRFD